MEPVYELLKKEIGLTALVCIIVVIALIVAVWKIAIKYASYKIRFDELPCNSHQEQLNDICNKHSLTQGKMNFLPCDEHSKKIEELSKTTVEVKVLLANLSGSIDGINRTLSMMTPLASSSSSFTQAHSPISVTELGKKIAAELNLDSAIDDNWGKISTIITTETNPYDIQVKFISELVVNFDKYLNYEVVNKIKLNAYESGNTLIEYMRMLGVMARDKYFLEHNIDIDEVDRNDPTLNHN